MVNLFSWIGSSGKIASFLISWKGFYTVLVIMFLLLNMKPFIDSGKQSFEQRTPAPFFKKMATEMFNANYRLGVASDIIIKDEGLKVKQGDYVFFNKLRGLYSIFLILLNFLLVLLIYVFLFRVFYLFFIFWDDSKIIPALMAGSILLIGIVTMGNLFIVSEEGEDIKFENSFRYNPFLGFMKFYQASPYFKNIIYIDGNNNIVGGLENV